MSMSKAEEAFYIKSVGFEEQIVALIGQLINLTETMRYHEVR